MVFGHTAGANHASISSHAPLEQLTAKDLKRLVLTAKAVVAKYGSDFDPILVRLEHELAAAKNSALSDAGAPSRFSRKR